MRRSSRQIARLYTTIDLGSVMNLSALSPADEPHGFARWDEDADPLALPGAEPHPGRPAWPPRAEQEMRW